MATEAKKEEAHDYRRLHSYPLIRHTDMPEEMRVEAMELCVTACEKFSTNNEDCSINGNFYIGKQGSKGLEQAGNQPDVSQSAAKMIKESMDKKFGSSWHAIVGEGFGFEITHETKNILYMFFAGNMAICIWKCS